MTKNEQVLVDFWVEIGKVRKEIYDPYDPAQGYRYFFINDYNGIRTERYMEIVFSLLSIPITTFYFQSGVEGAEILLNDVDVTSQHYPIQSVGKSTFY